MRHTNHLHPHLLVEPVNTVSHTSDHLIKIDHLIGPVLFNLMPDELKAFAEDKGT